MDFINLDVPEGLLRTLGAPNRRGSQPEYLGPFFWIAASIVIGHDFVVNVLLLAVMGFVEYLKGYESR